MTDFSLMELFRQEAEAQTQTLSEGVLALEHGNPSPAVSESLMRAAHSLKGAARIVGLEAAVGLAHVLEDYFVAVQKGTITPSPTHVDMLLQGVDLLSQLSKLSDAESAGWLAENEPVIAGYVANFEQLLAKGNAAKATSPVDEPFVIPAPVSQDTDPSESEEVRTLPAPATPAALPLVSTSRKRAETGLVASPELAPMAAAAPTPDKVVRVTADNLSRLMALAGESLVEAKQLTPFVGSLRELKSAHAVLADCLRSLENARSGDRLAEAREHAERCVAVLARRLEELEDFAHRSEDLSTRLHHEIVASRMRPLADGIRGFPRLVRDVARQLGKDVQFEVRGDQTGVDRDVLDKLEAPLNHLIRNALDHGIESPAERIAAGKSSTALVRLEAHHRAGMLQITLRDDGRGIDIVRLRRKVVERGLTTESITARLTDAELFEFLFLPGFSTRDAVTDLSGRGVGLDVVLSTVQALGGTVRVASTLGKETSFTLRLPISLSVIRALLVDIAGEPYAFPLTRVDRIDVVASDRIDFLEGRRHYQLDGQAVGLVEATEVLELPSSSIERTAFPVVLVSDRGHRFGMIVDAFLGERDLDVRPLDPRLGKVPDFNAASIVEGGQPVLIFDVEDLVRNIDNRVCGRRSAISPPKHVREKRILVVDDSITVRELERQLLEAAGYQVETAVDGMDGWNAIRKGTYDLVVSDVDMPRLDGIELVRRIKTDEHLKRTPVVIVSYKDRNEDRMRGMDAGADCYLTKGSFHDRTFIRAVADLIGEGAT